ncbi:archaeal ATPase [bacterium BMS3Abin03]|nr:archaeal ATPase [bacterium BMS3Abin03]
MFIERKIYPKLISHLQKRQITVITGMRRTGKTTLLRELLRTVQLSNKIYIDLERMDNRQIFMEANYENVVRALNQRGISFKERAIIAVDEIQLVPNVTSVIKYLYDKYNLKFIVTGSSSYYLKDMFTESLAGRKKIFELYPLDFGEFLTFNNVEFSSIKNFDNNFLLSEYQRLNFLYNSFISYGGFPEVVLEEKNEDKQDLLNDIIDSYINIDIRTLADFRYSNELFKLIRLLSARIGSKVDYSKLASLSGISRNTVKSYLEFFEKTYLITLLPVYTLNKDREIVKAKKLYFNDNGIANRLAELSSGVQFENAVFNQLKHFGDLNYYSLKSGQGIDFILNKEFAFDVKESPSETDLKKVIRLAKRIGINKVYLIGRHSIPNFTEYIYGGSIM